MYYIERSNELVNAFVETMKESIRFFADGKIPENDIAYLAEYEVNRIDFNNKQQIRTGFDYYARKAVGRYFSAMEEAD